MRERESRLIILSLENPREGSHILDTNTYIVDDARHVSSCFIWPSTARPFLS